MPVVDPGRNTATQIKLMVRDPKTPSQANNPPAQPSPYWGDEAIWTAQTTAHSFAMDGQARVWVAARIRPNATAAFCQQGSSHPSAMAFPIATSGRQMQLYDPKTKQVATIDTCFGTHHLNWQWRALFSAAAGRRLVRSTSTTKTRRRRRLDRVR